MTTQTALRPIHEVAQETVYFLRGLKPEHMARWAGLAQAEPLMSVRPGDAYFGDDRVDYVIACLLGNISGWRGEDAKRIRAEWKQHLASFKK